MGVARASRELVGVVKLRSLRDEAPKEKSDDTPRLVQSRKGTILEIFGSQKVYVCPVFGVTPLADH